MRAKEFTFTLNEAILKTDVPSDEWLQSERQYAQRKGRNRHGAPYMGTVTGFVRGRIEVPVELLAKLPGMSGEQSNVRQDSLQWLMQYMKKNGHLPKYGDPGAEHEYEPYINVAYNGEAWVNEGNHRIMAAAALGWKTLPIEIRYFDGGERVKSGPMYPGKIGIGKPNQLTERRRKRRVKEAGLVYKGYPCTKDCSGHMAGYDWSERRGINNPNQCPQGNSNSWHEGCLSKGQGR
jgi:hypothetical protein